nr:MAG TPA: hypothetical protein [Bacteriophage sp.]
MFLYILHRLVGYFCVTSPIKSVYNIDKKSEMISKNTPHNVRQRNIVYSNALRNVC